jgi:hypothetical protein
MLQWRKFFLLFIVTLFFFPNHSNAITKSASASFLNEDEVTKIISKDCSSNVSAGCGLDKKETKQNIRELCTKKNNENFSAKRCMHRAYSKALRRF